MIEVKKLLNKTTPLCFMPDGRLLCYKKGAVLVLKDNKTDRIIPIPISTKERLLGWSRLMTRLFRFGVRSSIALDNETAILNIGNSLLELNVESGKLSTGWYCGDGIRPLIMTRVEGISDFDDGIYFGGYLSNMEEKSVHIYRRIGMDKWEVVYTFSEGLINHVHNIVPDSYRNCLWIFTGDFGEASAIWKVTGNFKKVERVACNDQKYRGCVVFALPEGLLYATDAPFADDFIYLLNPETCDVKELCSIAGSCIYGCQWKDNYVFSSTVEGDGRNTPKMELLFGRKRGAGIKNEYVHMYMGNQKVGFREIYKGKKDGMPYYTFQFGVFKFPYGINNSDVLYFQPVATKNNDQDLMVYRE